MTKEERAPVLLQRPGASPRTEPVDLGFGNSVVIRVHETIEDRSIIQQATVTGKITAQRDGKTVEMGQLALGAAPLQTLIQMVVGWRGPAFCVTDHSTPDGYLDVPPGHNCETFLPITPENLKALLNGPGQKVLDQIEKNNPQANADGNPTKDSALKT